MPYDANDASSPLRWLRDAHGDLAMARIDLPEGATWEKLCFHAQQAAEKSIKGLMLSTGIEFPFTHNIELLVSLLPPEYHTNPIFVRATALSPYAVLTRYPGEIPAVTEIEYDEAVQAAAAVVEWVEDYVSRHG